MALQVRDGSTEFLSTLVDFMMWLERFRYDIVPEWKTIMPYGDKIAVKDDSFFVQLQNDWDMQVEAII